MAYKHPIQLQPRRWKRLRGQIFRRDNYRCQACGKVGRMECDHIKPIHDGGDLWDPKNLQSLCRGCHIRKTRDENRARQIIDLSRQRRAWSEYLKTV